MKKQLAIAALCIGVLYSCNGPEKQEVKESIAVKSNVSPDSIVVDDSHDHDESEPIELNKGAKWKVAERMIAYIRIMETEIRHFSERKPTGLNDYVRLGVSLQKNIDSLTSNCTMTGKAHDELHKWLLPYLEMVDELNKSKNETEAAKSFSNIQASFITFNKFFE